MVISLVQIRGKQETGCHERKGQEADVERVVVQSGRAAGDRLVLSWTLQKASASLDFCP